MRSFIKLSFFFFSIVALSCPVKAYPFLDFSLKIIPEVQIETSGKTSGNKKATPKKNTRKNTSSSNTSNKKTVTSSPKTSAEAKKKQQETAKEIKQTEAKIKENEAKVKKELAELGKIDTQIANTSLSIDTLNRRIKLLGAEISDIQIKIDSNEKNLENLRSEYLKAVKKMRVAKKNKNNLAFVFASQNMNQAIRRLRYLKEFSTWRQRQTDKINNIVNDLKIQKSDLQQTREAQDLALSLQKTNEAKLSAQHKKQEEIVAKLKENEGALKAHLAKKQVEAKELGSLISQLIAKEEEEKRQAAKEEKRRNEEKRLALEEEKKRQPQQSADNKNNSKEKKTSSNSGSTDYATARKRAPRGNSTTMSSNSSNKSADVYVKSSSDFQNMKGKLPYPVAGKFIVTSQFGRQHLPDLPDVEFENPGIDAETDPGAYAKAVFNGKVSGIYLLPGYNTVVIVNHGNYYTVYGNISSPLVKNGDEVKVGTNLGKLALDDDDQNHSSIHFEVWKNREKLNPQQWLK